MKTIGLLGGMSWVSTGIYYRLLNEAASTYQGPSHSAKLVLHSFDFDEIVQLHRAGKSDQVVDQFVTASRALEDAGADLIAMACNTFHSYAPAIVDEISVPFIDVRECLINTLLASGAKAPLLLGTRGVTESDFYINALKQRGLTPVVNGPEHRLAMDDLIFSELCRNKVTDRAKKVFKDVLTSGVELGADSVALGCSELRLLVNYNNVGTLRLFDTTQIHVEAICAEAQFVEQPGVRA